MDSNAAGVSHMGPYPLLARLGSGGMGTVYLALHRGAGGFEKKVAIKALLPHIAEDKQFIGMLVDEAKLMAQLTHPNIVQVIDLAHAGQSHFLVMEYVEGVDARTLAEHHELTLDEAVYLTAEAARGLAYAHRKCGPSGETLGIVHRDISGHNLLVSVEGVTKVMDFGIAKAASNRNATEVGVLKGKLAYMSPEQALGRSVDARSDLFSLGIVLWEMCTRERLFAGDTEMQVLLKVQKCEIEPPSRFIQGFPRDLEEIISKCLAVNPEHRYSDGDRLADELHGFLRSHQGAVHPRAKLAQRVSEYLRSHPPQSMEPLPGLTSGPGPLDQTQATSRNERTRISAQVRSVAVPKKSARESLRWMGGAVAAVVVIAGAAWTFGARNAVVKEMTNPTTVAVVRPKPIPKQSATVQPAPVEVTIAVPKVAPKIVTAIASGVVLKPKPVPITPPIAPLPVVSAQAPVAAAETGHLSINATPWARVYIDGVAVAESTPLLRHVLKAGEHKVVLVNPELKIRKELQMRILPGEHLRQKITLE